MALTTHDVFASAYAEGLRTVIREGGRVPPVNDALSVGSRFGREARSTRELSPYLLRVARPDACLFESRVRPPSLPFILGQWLWVMKGSDDVDEIAYYNPRGRDFSDDGAHLAGAFGRRMIPDSGDQLRAALNRVRKDPTTRRALVVLAHSADVVRASRDHPCAISFHLLLRGGRLEAITTMRSQSALKVFPYDAALFMMIHVWAAAVLRVDAGPHTWVANSFHLYEDELDLASAVAEEPLVPRRLPPIKDPEVSLADLLLYEHRLRTAVLAGDSAAARRTVADSSRDRDLASAVRAVLAAHAAERLADRSLLERARNQIPSAWKEMMNASFPAHRAGPSVVN